LALNHTEPNAFSPEQVELLMELAETLEEGFRRMDDLQVISSLLASAIEDPTALRCIENSRAQVQSMALIHERLYELDDLARLDCAEYVQALAENVFSSYGVDPDVARDNGTSFEVNYPIDSQSQRDLSEPNGR
jgi:two-component sensor histidine kinase